MEIKCEPSTGIRILLVEDERAVRDTVRQLLKGDDHTVVEANNGAEALGLFAQEHFDLVMTDHSMPFLTGSELASRIKQTHPMQPILMLTGQAMRPGPRNPVNAVLLKPFDLGEFRTALAEVL